MNKKNSKKINRKVKKMITSAHVLIAIVAIIECLVLIGFTTYSWIESASSLVIMNGPISTTTTDNVNINIADALNYQINLDASAGNAELDKFFSRTKYYRYGKASSADGTTFYFPKTNNSYASPTSTNAFRLGDTTDYNTSYTYFDFKINNTVGNKDFYFNDDTDDKKEIFTISDPSGYFDGKSYSITENNQTKTYDMTEAIRRAMRISIVETSSTGETSTTIYSPTGKSYRAQSGVGTSNANTTQITTEKISDYGLNYNSSLTNRNILFTSKKNKTHRVQIRIWFELKDPDYVAAFGSSVTSNDYKAISGVEIGINLSLGNADNNFRPFYFDDYTLSNTSGNEGGNITLDNASNQNYVVWFHGYSPDASGYVDYPMTREMTADGRTRWSADAVPQTITDYLCGDITPAQLNNCYFGYGSTVGGTPTYRWTLYEKPTAGTTEFIYNAYSVYKVTSSYYGSGCWNDRSSMRLIQFRDYATVLVSDAFNRSSSNYQVIKQNPVDHLFVNDQATYNASGSNHNNTASMYYDSTTEIFRSYVPATWSSVYFSFNLDNNGYSGIDFRFSAGAPTATNGLYIYTALGQDENYTLAYYDEHNAASGNGNYIAPGFGTWGAIERVYLNAELIDYDVKATDRYKVSIAGTDIDSTAKETYPMIPDATGMVYTAYIPAGAGTSPALKFVRLNNVNNNNAVNARWYSPVRGENNTFYPVKVDSTADSSDQTRGYWNLSVLVDGTYENLIYDTLTDGDGQGKLEYSTDGQTYTTIMVDSSTAGSPSTDTNRISAYRWYVPCSPGDTVYYRWTPYYGDDGVYGGNDDTEFIFTHQISDGLYCVVTEPDNAVTIPQNTPSAQRLAGRLLVGTLQANPEQSLSEEAATEAPTDDALIEQLLGETQTEAETAAEDTDAEEPDAEESDGEESIEEESQEESSE